MIGAVAQDTEEKVSKTSVDRSRYPDYTRFDQSSMTVLRDISGRSAYSRLQQFFTDSSNTCALQKAFRDSLEEECARATGDTPPLRFKGRAHLLHFPVAAALAFSLDARSGGQEGTFLTSGQPKTE